MIGAWWWWWMFMMLLFVVSPVSYGWGYRDWGPPYPSYVQRRRGERAIAAANHAHNHYAWSWGGDVVWLVALGGLVWVVLMRWAH